MASNKELVITADEVTINRDNRKLKVFLTGVDMDHVISDMDEGLFDEVLEWIRSNRNPDDVFSRKDLDKWAEGNGYAKE
jgi:hypothetical protein